MWSAERGWEDVDGDMSQNGKFGEMENAIGQADEDDNLVAILLLQTLAPACGALPTKKGRTHIWHSLGLSRGNLLSLP